MTYLRQYRFDELIEIKENFKEELEKAILDEKSSLSSIKTTIPDSKIEKDLKIQVLVLGGTNFKIADTKKIEDEIVIENIQEGIIPDITSKDKFLKFIDSIINKDVDYLAINLAYPMKQYCRGDIIDAKTGCFNNTNRNFYFPGKYLGKSLEDYFKYKKKLVVSVGHDITCLILSALDMYSQNSIICCVLGTGVNMGMYKDRSTIINLESGRFDKFKLSETGKKVDELSENRGEYLFEKETAGRYLYKHYNVIAEGYEFEKINSTEDLSYIAEENEDTIEVKSARNIFRRSASIFACKLASVIEYKSIPKISFVIEGSLFWKGWRYKDLVSKSLKRLGIDKDSYEFLEVENSSILGASRLFIR